MFHIQQMASHVALSFWVWVQVLDVEVFDADGMSYGHYFVGINTQNFASVCSGANTYEAPLFSTFCSF